MTDPNSWLMAGGVPAAKFETHGDTLTGTISEAPELRQQTDFDTGAPLVWDDGQPRMQLVVTLATTLRDPANEEDDGTRRLYVKGRMQQAVAAAIRKAEAKGLEIGGTLTIAYVGDDEPKRKGMSGAKIYTATYASPAAAFLAQPEPGAPASTAPVAVPQQSVLVEPAQAPAAPVAADLSALLSSLTPEQLAGLAAAQAGQKPAPF